MPEKLLPNLVFLFRTGLIYVLSLHTISKSSLVASDAATVLFGPLGASFIAAAVMISTFGANNGYVFTGARIYYAMAKEGFFFRSLQRVHPHYKTPNPSLVAQGVWSSILVLISSYEQLFTYAILTSWIFYAMACAGVFVLRKRNPNTPRPYRTWGYPYTPLLFITFAVYLVATTVREAPQDSLVGIVMIVSGIPAYFYWKRKRNDT